MVAKFAGQNVHKRLVDEETYKESRYEDALKRAFLGTDEEMLASASPHITCTISYSSRPGAHSGSIRLHCCCGSDNEGQDLHRALQLFVAYLHKTYQFRPTLATPAQSSA